MAQSKMNDLQAFLAVARLQSVTRAAEQIHLSQAGLSLLLREMETQLGVRLFDRTTRSVTLTEGGRQLQPVAERKAVRLTTRVADDVPEVVGTDALRLQQILFNLVSNAVKFSAGLERTGRVEIRADDAGAGMIRFVVTDNGIGMAPDVFEKIFQPFSQAESSTTRRFGGTGLGLSISARLVHMLEGRIDVRSLPGRGTRFVVTLPLTAISTPVARPTPAGPASVPPGAATVPARSSHPLPAAPSAGHPPAAQQCPPGPLSMTWSRGFRCAGPSTQRTRARPAPGAAGLQWP